MDLQWSLPASLTSGPREQWRSVAQGSMRRCDYPVNQLWLAGWQAKYWWCLTRPLWLTQVDGGGGRRKKRIKTKKEGLTDHTAGHCCWITINTDIKASTHRKANLAGCHARRPACLIDGLLTDNTLWKCLSKQRLNGVKTRNGDNRR